MPIGGDNQTLGEATQQFLYSPR